MHTRIAFSAGVAAVASLLAAGPAAAAAGKYCAVYKGEAMTTAAALSTAKAEDCRARSIRTGGDGYGLGCQVDAGEVVATPRTSNDATAPIDPTGWQTADQKIRDACTKEWGARQ